MPLFCKVRVKGADEKLKHCQKVTLLRDAEDAVLSKENKGRRCNSTCTINKNIKSKKMIDSICENNVRKVYKNQFF